MFNNAKKEIKKEMIPFVKFVTTIDKARVVVSTPGFIKAMNIVRSGEHRMNVKEPGLYTITFYHPVTDNVLLIMEKCQSFAE